MTRKLQNNLMDIDGPEGSKASSYGKHANGLNLYPVSANDSGEGLPYAPEDWPNPGDKWGWKVGKRLASSGHFLDRYLYLPGTLRKHGHGKGFASKLSVQQYIREKFPDADVRALFSSFSWRIPSKAVKKDYKQTPGPFGKSAEDQEPTDQSDEPRCKAGNRICSSLAADKDSVSEVMSCDICCSEPGFCGDCCCVLCCRIVDKASDSCSYIRCEANIDGYTCGHSCHIDCALRAYMAGTVGGSIGLDAEYYCRRCDSRTDLVSHVTKLLEDYKSIASRDDIEKILKIGICVLRGSERTSAKKMLHHIELAMSKLKNGDRVEDIWKMEDIPANSPGLSPNANGVSRIPNDEESPDHELGPPPALSSNFDHRVESLKLEDEIDHILGSLKRSQKIEYRLAEERLMAQKNYILNLYQQLDKERSEISRRKSLSKNREPMLDAVLERVDQIKREVSRLKDMEEVARGFGRVPKHILKEHFGLDIEH